MAAEYVLFQKTDINLLIVVVMVVVHFVYLIFYLTYWQPRNPAFIAALVVGIVMVLAAFVSAGARFAAFFPTPSFRWTLSRNVHQMLLSSPTVWALANDTLVTSISTCVSLFMLARVLEGPCDLSRTTWQQQHNCNNGGPGNLPTLEFMLDLTVICMCQVYLKGASVKAIVVSWLVKIAIVMVCVSLVGMDIFWWVWLLLIGMMGVSYEVERQSRRLFLNQRSVVQVTRSNAELLLELAKQKVAEKQRELDSKGAIVRQISHELRTPLNVVAIGVGLVRQNLGTSMPPFIAETLENCEEGCSMALEIISDFLAVEKLAAGMFTLEKVNTELVPYLQKAIKMFNTSADAKSITITLTPRGGSWDGAFVADIDPLKMNNVLRNLLSNAVKFSKTGGCVAVTLDNMPPEAPGGEDNVLITVTDDGAGISPENIKRLFTEGTQFNANSLQAGGGR